jgi:hypothetical protein
MLIITIISYMQKNHFYRSIRQWIEVLVKVRLGVLYRIVNWGLLREIRVCRESIFITLLFMVHLERHLMRWWVVICRRMWILLRDLGLERVFRRLIVVRFKQGRSWSLVLLRLIVWLILLVFLMDLSLTIGSLCIIWSDSFIFYIQIFIFINH